MGGAADLVREVVREHDEGVVDEQADVHDLVAAGHDVGFAVLGGGEGGFVEVYGCGVGDAEVRVMGGMGVVMGSPRGKGSYGDNLAGLAFRTAAVSSCEYGTCEKKNLGIAQLKQLEDNIVNYIIKECVSLELVDYDTRSMGS